VEAAVAIGGSGVGATTPDQVPGAELMDPLDEVAHAATIALAARVSEPVVNRASRRDLVPADVIAAFSP
jgi:hypothetical protein